MIPKNIFFFYDTGYDSLHPKLKENIEFVKNQNPDYNVKVYDTESCFGSKQELDINNCFMMSAEHTHFFKLVIDKFHSNVDLYHTLELNVNSPKKNFMRLFSTYMLADIVRDNDIPNVIKSKNWSKYGIFSFCNTSGRMFSTEHHELYQKPPYRTIHEHLILK